MIGQKKEAPEFLTKWEKENKIVSYHWTENSVKDIKTGKNTVISSQRAYGVNDRNILVNLPQEIKDYFEKKVIPEEKAEEKAEEKSKRGK